MSFSPNLEDRERDKFVESPSRPGRTAVETFDINSINGPLSGVVWDAFDYQYPTTTQEIIQLYEGGLSGTLKARVVLNYTDATKKFLLDGTVSV
jgi:hypothetical protein